MAKDPRNPKKPRSPRKPRSKSTKLLTREGDLVITPPKTEKEKPPSK